MKKTCIKVLTMCMVVVMIISTLGACGSSNQSSDSANASQSTTAVDSTNTQKAAEPVSLTFMLWGDKPVGMDEVLAEYEKRTKDTLNTKIDIIWTPMGEFFNKVKLKLAAGEEVDSAFDAPWANMTQGINQGTYLELDKYFLSDSYPGLKKAFGEQYVNNNKFNGKTYGVPFTTGYKEVYGFFVRKDLREKYGMAMISNISELEQYFENVKKNDSKLIPLADDGNALRSWYGLNDENEYYNSKANTFSLSLTGGLFIDAKLSDDKKKCVSVQFGGDRSEPQVGIPYNNAEISKSWMDKGFFEKDLLTQQNATGLFKAGKAAAVAHGVSQYSSLESELKKAVPNAQIEFFVSSDSQRALLPNAMKTDFKAFNFACIPSTSTKVEATMKFYDWLFADKANHDLFELGIENKDWTADGDKMFKYPEGGNKYVFPGYQLTWNPTMVRNLAGMDEKVYKILDYEMDVNSYYQTPLGGFTFNSDPVKLEIAKVQPVMDQIGQIYGSGVSEDAYKKAHEYNTKARKLGLDKIREEAMKQINEYLASK